MASISKYSKGIKVEYGGQFLIGLDEIDNRSHTVRNRALIVQDIVNEKIYEAAESVLAHLLSDESLIVEAVYKKDDSLAED